MSGRSFDVGDFIMARRTTALLLLSLGLALSGCMASSARSSRTEPASASFSSNGEVPKVVAQTLGSGDVFEVRVVGEEELSGAYRVASDGAVAFPFCGRVILGGMTAPEASETLTGCLGNGYIKNPQVTVFIKEQNSKKVFVFGEVSKPGTFVFEDGMNVIQAITMAEGFSKLAAKNNVVVTRNVDGRERKIRVRVDDIGTGRQENFLLVPGDIVFVPESFF